jgi:probable HAF family extracellular repeat protein
MTDLGTLGGGASYAVGINDAGQVTGYSFTADGTRHAFITGPNGTGMTDLGTLGGSDSFAIGINDAGQVIGHSLNAYGSPQAFVTGPNGLEITDLNTGGWSNAIAINNMGQVIATIVPEPESYALMLAGLAVVGVIVRRKQEQKG